MVSENLQTYMTTLLWMRDEQDQSVKLMSFKIKWDEVPPEIAQELKDWFNDCLTKSPRPAVDYKVNLGCRSGVFPISSDHKAIHFMCDSISGQLSGRYNQRLNSSISN